jgi:hypothetical protein
MERLSDPLGQHDQVGGLPVPGEAKPDRDPPIPASHGCRDDDRRDAVGLTCGDSS